MLPLILEAPAALVRELVASDEARFGARDCLPQRTHSVDRLRSGLRRREGGGGHHSSLSEGKALLTGRTTIDRSPAARLFHITHSEPYADSRREVPVEVAEPIGSESLDFPQCHCSRAEERLDIDALTSRCERRQIRCTPPKHVHRACCSRRQPWRRPTSS
jgi:hypothetical protein